MTDQSTQDTYGARLLARARDHGMTSEELATLLGISAPRIRALAGPAALDHHTAVVLRTLAERLDLPWTDWLTADQPWPDPPAADARHDPARVHAVLAAAFGQPLHLSEIADVLGSRLGRVQAAADQLATRARPGGGTRLAIGSALFLSTSPWLARWWVAHLGLFVCAACLVIGIGAERARRGHLAGVALLDRLPQLAEHVLDATSDGIAVRDEAGRLVGWNPAAVTLTGWSRQEAEQRFTPDRQGLLDLGAGRWVDMRCEHIRRYGADYTVTIFRDASAEVELHGRQAELAAFAGVVAHDLKSPLGAVRGFLGLLDETVIAHLTGPQAEDGRQLLDHASAGALQMQRLIDDLLAYTTARDAALHRTAVDLRVLVDEVVATRTADPAHRGDGDRRRPGIYVGPLPTVHGDPVRLRQVFDNLIGNALKYTPPGQPVRVTVTAQPDRDGWTAIEVADRGIGIPDGEHAAVFERFHRAHPDARYPGTGLGLAICHRIIERHGGAITATDNPGGGAIFRFTLPLVQTTSPSPTGTARHAAQLDPAAPSRPSA
jgi:signal transduction histidine kinase